MHSPGGSTGTGPQQSEHTFAIGKFSSFSQKFQDFYKTFHDSQLFLRQFVVT